MRSQPRPASLGEGDELVAQPVGLLHREARYGDCGGCRSRHEVEIGEAERASDGPAGDVDELHAAVRHRDLTRRGSNAMLTSDTTPITMAAQSAHHCCQSR